MTTLLTSRSLGGGDATFVRNAWYAAAWSEELGHDKPLGCTMLGNPVVLYRNAAGTPVALEDRCIHRSLPLSLGRIRGDVIECGYHGLQYETSGRCVRIPGQPSIPRSACIRSYPVIEQDGFVWLWMGESARADRSAITRFSWMSRAGWRKTTLHARIACNYQLVIDNLLDLSHLAFVHASTVGSPELADNAIVETQRIDLGVRTSRWTLDVAPAATYAQFGRYDGNVDRWQITEFTPPCTLVIRNGAAKAGTGAREGRGEQRWEFIVCHAVTPETARTTSYFWAVTHDFGGDDAEAIAEFHRQCHHVIGEDIAVFTAQQKMLDLTPDAPLLGIRYDHGPLQARLAIERLLAAERDAARPRSIEPHVSA
ncbi:MAG TPA: aromatic ring-hydroxylating dioxygenase subunit alpha [Casimicrobiaceae bacterium]|nr:aromatic ring-hydroxylating dioxygenase subunit alpha [Casimicrobiaceae bacterium]